MKNNPTHALTAALSATAPVTDSTATALSADSPPTKEIKPFIEQCLKAHHSDDFSSIKHSAEEAARHGFSNSANSRLVEFLEDFHSSPLLSKQYAERYPNCVFLPWPAFHRTLDALELWCDLPEHYVGAIPPSQLPWLDCFELQKKDETTFEDFTRLLKIQRANTWDDHRAPMSSAERLRAEVLEDLYNEEIRVSATFMQASRQAIYGVMKNARLFDTSYFVIAPPEAFNTTEDFISRTKRMAVVATEPTTPPDDPLVVRFCLGGALVVAAWGEEAAELNKITRELKL